jgi:hypothetical protein
MARGPSGARGPSEGRTPETPTDKAISNDDRIWMQERHNRRLMLMRMQGETNRMETRLITFWAIAVILGGLALAMFAMS